MNQLRERLRRFMIGRYGLDQLGRFCYFMLIAVILMGIFIRRGVMGWVLEGVQLFLVIILLFRMLSRNIGRRSMENQAFMRLAFYAGERWKAVKFRFSEGHRYKIFKCPGCGQKVRIPRGHGKVSIHCPKCGNDFIKRS